MGAGMNEVKQYLIRCNRDGCGKTSPGSGFYVGVSINSKGIAHQKWQCSPVFVCPFCGREARYTYVELGPVVADEVDSSELIPVPAEWLKVPAK